MSEKRNYRKFTAQQETELVLASLRGQKTVAEICRENDISETLLRRWWSSAMSTAPLLLCATATSRPWKSVRRSTQPLVMFSAHQATEDSVRVDQLIPPILHELSSRPLLCLEIIGLVRAPVRDVTAAWQRADASGYFEYTGFDGRAALSRPAEPSLRRNALTSASARSSRTRLIACGAEPHSRRIPRKRGSGAVTGCGRGLS